MFSRQRTSRHDHEVGELRSWAQKAIRRGESLQAQYAAGELDLSGWGNAVWIRLFVIATEDIGLAVPGAVATVDDAYAAWNEAIRAYQEVPLAQVRRAASHGVVEARRVLMETVDWLARCEKSRMVALASSWSRLAVAADAGLRGEDWAVQRDALPWGLRAQLGLRLGPPLTEAEQQAACALAHALIERDERRALRLGRLLLAWGQRALLWDVVGWCGALVGEAALSGHVALCQRLHTRPPAGSSEDYFAVQALCALCRPALFPGPTVPKGSLEERAIARWYRPTLRRPEVPDWALDRHTMRGARMGRGMRHFFQVGALVSPQSARVDDPYEEEVQAWYFATEDARGAGEAKVGRAFAQRADALARARQARAPG